MSAARKPAARRTASARRGAHASAQAAPRPVDVVVITVSDTRRGAEDTSGALAERLLVRAGCIVSKRAWVRDDVAAIRRAVRAEAARKVNAIKIWVDDRGGRAPRLPPALMRAAIDEGRRAGLKDEATPEALLERRKSLSELSAYYNTQG